MEDITSWQLKFEHCYYSNRLLNKLRLINSKSKNKVDIIEIKKAIYYAKKYHGTQERQSGEPYYSHPIEVAYMVSDYLFRTDILVTSILHDTIEDTALSKDLIEVIFDTRVANQVKDLTRIKDNCKLSSAEIVESLWNQKKYDLLLIKQFDRIHNMKTVWVKSPEKKQKIIEETFKRFITLSMYLEDKITGTLKTEEDITELCYQNLYIKKHSAQEHVMVLEDNFQLPSPTFQSDSIPNHILYLLES